jgi:hypothetical protein
VPDPSNVRNGSFSAWPVWVEADIRLSTDCGRSLQGADFLQKPPQGCLSLRIQWQRHQSCFLAEAVQRRVCYRNAREVIPIPVAPIPFKKVSQVALYILCCQIDTRLQPEELFGQLDEQNDRDSNRCEQDG